MAEAEPSSFSSQLKVNPQKTAHKVRTKSSYNNLSCKVSSFHLNTLSKSLFYTTVNLLTVKSRETFVDCLQPPRILQSDSFSKCLPVLIRKKVPTKQTFLDSTKAAKPNPNRLHRQSLFR